MIGSPRRVVVLVWLILVAATCLSLWVGEIAFRPPVPGSPPAC
jgi:hypothetical protein